MFKIKCLIGKLQSSEPFSPISSINLWSYVFIQITNNEAKIADMSNFGIKGRLNWYIFLFIKKNLQLLQIYSSCVASK